MVETLPGKITEAEFMALPHDLGHIELVDGEVKRVPTEMELRTSGR